MRIDVSIGQGRRQERQCPQRNSDDQERHGKAAQAQHHFWQAGRVRRDNAVMETAGNFISREDRKRVCLTADDNYIYLRQAAHDDHSGRQRDHAAIFSGCRVIEQGQRGQATNNDLTDPEHGGVDTAIAQDEGFDPVMFRGVQVRQVLHGGEIQDSGDEDAKQVFQVLDCRITQGPVSSVATDHQDQNENRQPERERHNDEHGCHDGGVIGLAGNEKAEDGTGACGQRQTPDKGNHTRKPGIAVHTPF